MAVASCRAQTAAARTTGRAADYRATDITALRTLSSELQTRATALLADGTSEERKQLLAERDELVNREWLAGIENDIIAEINRKKAIAVLQKASRDTVTNRITAKSAEIAESLVTKRASGLVRQGSEPAECGWVGN